MKNTISERIFDFIKNIPPFSYLKTEDIFTISEHIIVYYFPENQIIFKQNDPVHDVFYVIKEGAILLIDELNPIPVDQCDEGDIFGLRAVIRKKNYLLKATAFEESIVYGIPSTYYEEFIQPNKLANNYLLSTFAGNLPSNSSKEDHELLEKAPLLQNINPYVHQFIPVQYSKNPLTCYANLAIREAAKKMSDCNVGSMIISDKKNKPIGIVTDKDLRKKIATGLVDINESVNKIMSSPVITVSPNLNQSEAQIKMLSNKIKHLCVTESGSQDAPIVGVISEHDILLNLANNPLSIHKSIKRAKSVSELKEIRKKTSFLLENYIQQKVPIDFITSIISLVNEGITAKIIDFSIEEMREKPPVAFAWISLGSQGRREQILLSDQDNAIIYANRTSEENAINKNYFLSLANKINIGLHEIGFEYCPAEMMANNPKWCLTLEEWKAKFHDWITLPDQEKMMLCTIFFDFQTIYGDENLTSELSESILKSLDEYPIFLNHFALNALKNPPPLSFFRQFLVEQSGEHKDQFDIKLKAIMPLVDAARVLIFSNKITAINNTLKRFAHLIECEPQNSEIYDHCMESYTTLLSFRAIQGMMYNNTGRYIDIQQLNKADRLKLKNCFKAISEVQKLMQTRFQLAQLM
ncbi:DUF294 nucleotidyltransferase-like domain-containing protein [Namhaeicola litoreus]|uniref:DUF294 nucleotidyltransferase-like domain-containing protein n=1 Tax=Namhaeicola litoreus TaxID=1052145 RepID=A0ABW3Y355_9FLAO